ncbi:hypothetical protein HPB52_008785 [Rhipicephalus sanguineus]|uniref:Uncharacterized protein n=1 Tax=Rhipicephalus sanguineus TaxID=34632 RepID=A0A9D4PXW1_RHISA|nr:hypothetical protein HPB52_008785 [Rhipicephalus sanguineus]
MALFGSLMRDLESDPFFGPFEGMRQMEAMLGPMLGAFPGLGGTRRSASLGLFPTDMFSTIDCLSQDPNCHSFSSSSVMTMTTDENGRPQVYQASQSTRVAPGGFKVVTVKRSTETFVAVLAPWKEFLLEPPLADGCLTHFEASGSS